MALVPYPWDVQEVLDDLTAHIRRQPSPFFTPPERVTVQCQCVSSAVGVGVEITKQVRQRERAQGATTRSGIHRNRRWPQPLLKITVKRPRQKRSTAKKAAKLTDEHPPNTTPDIQHHPTKTQPRPTPHTHPPSSTAFSVSTSKASKKKQMIYCCVQSVKG